VPMPARPTQIADLHRIDKAVVIKEVEAAPASGESGDSTALPTTTPRRCSTNPSGAYGPVHAEVQGSP
jgi:hypothetical protein